MPKCHLLAIGTHSYLLVTACCATTVLRLIKICIMGSPSRRNSDCRKSAIFFRARRISITVFAHHTLARLHGALQGLRIRNSDLADGDSIKFHTCGSSALPILLRYSRWLTSTPRETGRCCVIKSSPNLSSLRPLSTLHASSPLPRFSLSSHFRRVRSTCRNGVHGVVTSQSLWSRYDRHFVGIPRYNAFS